MNIIMLCDEYPPGCHGGIGTVVQLLARAYVRQGHKVIVTGLYDWGYGELDRFEDEGVVVYRFRFGLASKYLQRKNSLAVRLAYRMLRISGSLQWDITRTLKAYQGHIEELISQYGIELVEMPDFQEYVPYLSKYTPFPKLSVPVVVKLHGSVTYFLKEAGKEVPEAIYKSELHLLNSATAVTSVSAYTSKKTAQYFNYSRPIEVLYNGIDPTAHTIVEKDPNLVIFTGSLVEKKGIYQLMKAWNIVQQNLPTARLHVYGKGQVHRVRSILGKVAQSSVTFMGHVPRNELFTALSRCMVAVFPSYAETFGMAALEAMATGAPVINTSRSSGPELVEDGKDGLLVDPDKPEEIAEKILYLLTNRDVALALATEGMKKVERDFRIDYIAERNIDYYQHVIGSIK